MKSSRRGTAKKPLKLHALQETPGFMVRLLQLKYFETFYAQFAELGLSPVTYSILIMLHENPGVGATDVASVLRLRLPNLIKLLNELEGAGLIKRMRSMTDGRAIELALTSKGERIAAQALRMNGPYNQAMLADLSENERRQFIEVLRKLVQL